MRVVIEGKWFSESFLRYVEFCAAAKRLKAAHALGHRDRIVTERLYLSRHDKV